MNSKPEVDEEVPIRNRVRSNSGGSGVGAPGVPNNTPVTRSIAGDGQPFDADDVNDLITTRADILSGYPHLVPNNTPAPTSSPGTRSVATDDLNTIDEGDEAAPSISDAASDMSTRDSSNGDQPDAPPVITTLFALSIGVLITIGAHRVLAPLATQYMQRRRSEAHAGRSSSSNGGVSEHTDWHDDILQDLDRGLSRLANLAEDDHQNDPSKSAAEHYKARLESLINAEHRKFRYNDLGPSTVVPVSTASVAPARRVSNPSRAQVDRLILSFNQLAPALGTIEQLKIRMDELNGLKEELLALKAEVAAIKTQLANHLMHK